MRLSDIVCLQICRLPNRKTHGKFTETILGKGVHKKVEKYGLLTNPPQPVSHNIESIAIYGIPVRDASVSKNSQMGMGAQPDFISLIQKKSKKSE